MKPDALGFIEDAKTGDRLRFPIEREGIPLDEDDFLLMAMLQDQIYCAELLREDPKNHDYGGLYRVYDYQYPLNRVVANYAGIASARYTGKTESEKNKAISHPFRRLAENLLVTAPELIHLLPLTDEIEDIISETRLTREMLDYRHGRTGFTHRPFQVNFRDGTKIVGRIPRRSGTGVKGQHEPDLIIEEAQDYPENGWMEVHETVMKDHRDPEGRPDFTYHFYGVHSGDRASTFYRHASSGNFELVQVTAIMRHGWGKAEKAAAKSVYGGMDSPDYRRNILGEAGSAASAYFVLARLMACMDQDRDSDYNQLEYVAQKISAEELDEQKMSIKDVLDLPTGYGKVWAGMDIGLAQSPTVISLWAEKQVKKVNRLVLFRRINLARLREGQIIDAWLTIGRFYGERLKGFGVDSTGLGLPIMQAMEDHANAPQHLIDVTRGYFFNAGIPVSVDPAFVTEDKKGNLDDGYGSAVRKEVDPFTNEERYVTYMPMIEASTRYLREFVDSTYLLLPFDEDIARDMQAETKQRVERLSGIKNKPDAFHILDSFRVMAMVFHAGRIEAALEPAAQEDVLDEAVEPLGAAGF